MSCNKSLTLDSLCKETGLNRNILAFEMRKFKSMGIDEQVFLSYHRAVFLGETRFSLKEYHIKLSPNDAIFYNDAFFLSLGALCSYYRIQPRAVKSEFAKGMPLSRAVDNIIKRNVKPKKEVLLNYTEPELDFLGLTPDAKVVIREYNLDTREIVYNASQCQMGLSDYVIKLGADLKSKSVDDVLPELASTTTRTSVSDIYTSEKSREVAITTLKGLGYDTGFYNINPIINDAYSLRLSLNAFIPALRRYNILGMYLKKEYQKPITISGRHFESLDSMLKQTGMAKLEFRITLFQFEGDIARAVGWLMRNGSHVTGTYRTGAGGKSIQYRGKSYSSISQLSSDLNLPYDILVKQIPPCLLPNAQRTVDEVIDEVMFNTSNNFVTIDGVRVLLKTSKQSYKNITQLCHVEGVTKYHLFKSLRSGATLERAIEMAKIVEVSKAK